MNQHEQSHPLPSITSSLEKKSHVKINLIDLKKLFYIMEKINLQKKNPSDSKKF